MTRTTNPTPALIDLGTTANNGLGTNLRDGGDIINRNFQDLYTAVNAINDYTLPTATTTTKGGVIVDGSSVTITNGVISAHASGGTSVSPSNTLPLIEGTAAIGTSLAYARADHVHPAASGGAAIPSGVIVMWSGTVSSIPSGWALCDGSNGTPNLRDRFIVGAGTSYTVGGTGGSADAIVVTHSHTMGSATFIGSAMAAHTHTITDPGHTHTIPDVGNTTNDGGSIDSAPNVTTPQTYFTVPSNTTGISINSASAGTPSGTIGGSSDTTGTSGVGKNLPPYYALAFIMKS